MTNATQSKLHTLGFRKFTANAVAYSALVLLSMLFLAPFFWMVSTSLKNDTQIFSDTVKWMPKPAVWQNYPLALQSFPFVLYLKNTLIICVFSTIGAIFSSALPAYGFSKMQWKGRDAVFVLLITTIMLPSIVTLMPVFLIFRSLGWIGTFLPLVVPSFTGSAFFIFLLRQFFLSIPQELSDAARIDGCGELGILLKVICPVAKPALVTIGLFAFTNAWMDFINPLIFLHDEHSYTLAIGLQAFLGRHGGEWSMLMAASTVITIPMLILFFFAQRTFIQGIALTGMKG